MSLLSAEQVPFWTAIAALAASATALVTIAYTYFTMRLVQAQAEPKVIVYVRHDIDRPSILLLVIENIGRDIARSVTFKSSRAIPAKAFGIEGPAGPPQVMTDGPFLVGIPSLGPGDSRIITWGQYGGLAAAIGTTPISLEYTYQHGRRSLTGATALEVQSFANTDASDRPAVASARALKDLAASAKQIAQDLHREVSRRDDEADRAAEPVVQADPLRQPSPGHSRPRCKLSLRGQPPSASAVSLTPTLGRMATIVRYPGELLPPSPAFRETRASARQ